MYSLEGVFFYFWTVPVLFSVILHAWNTVWMHACARQYTFQCNPIQNHTIYSPGGNYIYKALTLSNIYKHSADAISFLSLSYYPSPRSFSPQAFRSHVSDVEWLGPCRKSVLESIAPLGNDIWEEFLWIHTHSVSLATTSWGERAV